MSVAHFSRLAEQEYYLGKVQRDLDSAVNFWLKYSHDDEAKNGFFNCLGKDGKLLDVTKHGMLQSRQVWMYTELYRKTDRFKTDKILEAAIRGGDFLLSKMLDPATGHLATQVRVGKDGQVTMKKRADTHIGMFANASFAMAMAGLAAATGKEKYKEEAFSMLSHVLDFFGGVGSKKRAGVTAHAHAQEEQSLEEVFFVFNAAQELRDCLGEKDKERSQQIEEICSWCVSRIRLHSQRGDTRILSYIDSQKDCELSSVPLSHGREMMPGLAMQTGYLLLREANRSGDHGLRKFAVKNFIQQPAEYGWDREHGGLFYYMDVDGLPSLRLEWDLKLWWVHCEAMVALLTAYKDTNHPELWDMFKLVADYAFKHFEDPDHDDWFGYMTRDGHICLDLKGGPWKGCFHVPRTLLLCEKMLQEYVGEVHLEHL